MYVTQFQTEELEYMMMGFILENKNRTGAQTRGWGLGIRTNYGETETKSINRNEWVARVDEGSEGHEGS